MSILLSSPALRLRHARLDRASSPEARYYMQCPIEGVECTYSRVTGWNSTACGKYARRTLISKQAPALAYTPASASKQGRRAKSKGSPALLCAF